jgi:hypothetical protein
MNEENIDEFNENIEEFNEDIDLDKETRKFDSGEGNTYYSLYNLDHLARLFQGSSKCSAVYLFKKDASYKIWIARNDYYANSGDDNNATKHFNTILELFDFYAQKNIKKIDKFKHEKDYLLTAMKSLINNYQPEKHISLNKNQKDFIAELVVLKNEADALICQKDLKGMSSEPY